MLFAFWFDHISHFDFCKSNMANDLANEPLINRDLNEPLEEKDDTVLHPWFAGTSIFDDIENHLFELGDDGRNDFLTDLIAVRENRSLLYDFVNRYGVIFESTLASVGVNMTDSESTEYFVRQVDHFIVSE